MSDPNSLEALQAFHKQLVATCEHRLQNIELLQHSLQLHAQLFKKLLDRKPRKKESRDAVQSGAILVFGEDYAVNKEFQEIALQLADEVELDEVEAAKILLESEDDQIALGRPLLECGLIRFHQQRKYLLDCMRLCISIADNHSLDDDVRMVADEFITRYIFGAPAPGEAASDRATRFVPRCMAAMEEIKQCLQKLADRITASLVLQPTIFSRPMEFKEAMEFSRLSLIQQHESLAIILFAAIDKGQSEAEDFRRTLQLLKSADRYDNLLVHLIPVVGVYIRTYGSPEGAGDITLSRELNKTLCAQPDGDTWLIRPLRAAIVAWWIVEYSGWYVEEQAGAPLDSYDLDEEDKERTTQFAEALKDGAFDFFLSVAADVRPPDWQDPTRVGLQQWMQRKTPMLASEAAMFSDDFHTLVSEQLEAFVDGFISNLPDILRRLRVEEDEQRQLSQTHEQGLDLERFLLIISFAYGGRDEAAEGFWTDPDSNLAGFLHWASRRASTPLVSAFCEMLQAISGNERNADAAHAFLGEDSAPSSGKMRRSQSLSWAQIFRELEFFTLKIRDRANAPQLQTYRAGKPSTEQSETEPESAIMLECYLRLMSRLSVNSPTARSQLLKTTFSLVPLLFQLASLPIPGRLRACVFYTLKAFLTGKDQRESDVMWTCVDAFVSGSFQNVQTPHRTGTSVPSPSTPSHLWNVVDEINRGFDEPNAFVQLLVSLVTPPTPTEAEPAVSGTLPFPENLGASIRMPGIESYVDFVLGGTFVKSSADIPDPQELRIMRLSCLQFARTCLETFDEDLILIGNQTTIAVDAVIPTTDLAAYVQLHPFARVMEWMFNAKVVESLFNTIHQDASDIGSAAPDSPLIMSIIQAVEVIREVLDSQDTYLDLVRPVIRAQSVQRVSPVNQTAYSSFEEGIMNHLDLIADLGRCCGLGHPGLTLGCLKLLEKISASSRIISAWNPGPGQHLHRNKAIVALEKNDAAESISGSFISEVGVPLDPLQEEDSPNYMIKLYILEFLASCLRASPNQPSMAHLLLGFQCGINTVSVERGSSFEKGNSLFHKLLRLLLETPVDDGQNGVRHWLVLLKRQAMLVFQLLWSSPLSSGPVLSELRGNDFLFHILLRETSLSPDQVWDGDTLVSSESLGRPAVLSFIQSLALRAMTLEYMGIELCSVSQNRLPSLKRRIFDALSGRIVNDDNEPIAVPTIFDLFDFAAVGASWSIEPPSFKYYGDLDLRCCLEDDSASRPVHNIDKVREIVVLKRAEIRMSRLVTTEEQRLAMDTEEENLMAYLMLSNRREELELNRRKALASWSNLLVMLESNDFRGNAKTSFLLRALQAILPSLDSYSSENSSEAFELAKLAKILLFKLDLDSTQDSAEPADDGRALGNLVSDKLFQLFQVCLDAIGKWAGNADLRAMYYGICYRYVAGIVDMSRNFEPGRQKTIKSIQLYGERLLGVICDDAYGSDTKCQTAALILLGALVNLGNHDDDAQTVETLNRLNFIGVLVDSLKHLMRESLSAIESGNVELQQYLDAKLALLLQLCQTRDGAKYVLQANLFRSIELSGLFSADPELEIDPTNATALAQHYAILSQVTRIVGAAVLSRGAHNVLQGRRFLTEHRMLVTHILKRSAGIGSMAPALENKIGDLAEAFMVLITATGFLEFENQVPTQQKTPRALFH